MKRPLTAAVLASLIVSACAQEASRSNLRSRRSLAKQITVQNGDVTGIGDAQDRLITFSGSNEGLFSPASFPIGSVIKLSRTEVGDVSIESGVVLNSGLGFDVGLPDELTEFFSAGGAVFSDPLVVGLEIPAGKDLAKLFAGLLVTPSGSQSSYKSAIPLSDPSQVEIDGQMAWVKVPFNHAKVFIFEGNDGTDPFASEFLRTEDLIDQLIRLSTAQATSAGTFSANQPIDLSTDSVRVTSKAMTQTALQVDTVLSHQINPIPGSIAQVSASVTAGVHSLSEDLRVEFEVDPSALGSGQPSVIVNNGDSRSYVLPQSNVTVAGSKKTVVAIVPRSLVNGRVAIDVILVPFTGEVPASYDVVNDLGQIQNPTPPALTSEATTVQSSSSAVVSWQSGGGYTRGYSVNLGTLANEPQSCSSAGSSQQTGTSINASSLSPDTSYVLKVCATNNNQPTQGYGEESEITFQTLASGPSVTAANNYASGLLVKLDPKDNPSTTQYAVSLTTGATTTWLGTDGSTSAAGEVWGTFSQFGAGGGIVANGLTLGSSYQVKVKARNGAGIETSLSSASSAIASASDTAPSLATISDQSVVELSAVSAINANDGGDDLDADGDAITYSCYYDTSANDSVANSSLCTTLSGLSFTSSTGVMSWTPSVSQAGTYEFKVIGSEGNLSDDEIFVVTVTDFTPAAPSSPGATAGNAQNTISWTASTGATSYNIYWATSTGVTTSSTKITGATSPYAHTSLTNGAAYYYKIEAVAGTTVSSLTSEISSTPSGASDGNSWTATTTTGAPAARVGGSMIWTGSKVILWGGARGGSAIAEGYSYDPTTDSWTAISATNQPSARQSHSAIWTGSKMIVWGGIEDGGNQLNTGGMYDPVSNTWLATSTTDAPTARSSHSAVWTGSKMIVWGGGDKVNTGVLIPI